MLAAVMGIALGVGVVYLDQREARPVFAQGSGSCQQQEEACGRINNQGHSASCHSQWVQCMTNKCMGGAGAVGQCVQDSECQASCTESATSQGGKLSCCDGGPKHGNTCRDKVDGKCNPKQTELEKGKEEGKGGEMPKLPEMPKGGGGEPKPKEDPCAQGASSSECKATQAPSGVSGFLGNLFGTNSGTESAGTNSVSSALQSAASKLQSFFSGESTTAANTDSTNSVNNPTEAVVTPVTPSASQAGQIASQSGSSQQGAVNTGGTTGVGSTVTGFGSGAQADVNTQSGPIVAAMKGIVTRIQGILSSLFQ